MSYTVCYTGSREQRRISAFADAMEYLGEERKWKVLNVIVEILRDETVSLRVRRNQCRLALSFAGLQGAPAWAITKTMWMTRSSW